MIKVAKEFVGKATFAISSWEEFGHEVNEYGLEKGDKPVVGARDAKNMKYVMTEEYRYVCLYSTGTCVCTVQVHVFVQYRCMFVLYRYMCLYSTDTCVCTVQVHVFVQYSYVCFYSIGTCVCTVQVHVFVQYRYMFMYMFSD